MPPPLPPPPHLFLLSTILYLLPATTAIDFIFNSFTSTTNLSLFGNASIESPTLHLTNNVPFTVGRAFFPSKIPTKQAQNSSSVSPFWVSFIFSIAPLNGYLPGHGLTLIFAPTAAIDGVDSAQHLALFNFTNNNNERNHVLAIEFDVFKNPEFNDINDNHVGIDVNSLTSTDSYEAGYWEDTSTDSFRKLTLNNGVNYQVWVDYANFGINVTMAPVGRKRPLRPLISTDIDLTSVFLDEMYVGFTAATGRLVESHRILSWSFSNSNSSIGDALLTTNLPSFVPPKSSNFPLKAFIIGVSVGFVCFVALGVIVCLVLMKRKRKKAVDVEEWELEYWPHRIAYDEIHAATKGFSDENVIGFGGNGKVYKGVLAGGIETAVKRISCVNEHGMREFLAEVSSLGRLKHRNLVALRGWCKRDKGSVILIYDYMENGSLDKRIFDCQQNMVLRWEERVRVLKDIACGILYLHEEWEVKVLHRDIKSSNVLLDKDMNARLGDFGLARIYANGEDTSTTRVVGTVGYMAPEVVLTGRASAKTDVFGFGVLILEVMCGRRPIEEGKLGLIEWVLRLMESGEPVEALDDRIKGNGGYRDAEVERVIRLGLLCTYPDPKDRPTMRQVVKELVGGVGVGGELMQLNLVDRRRSAVCYRANPRFEDVVTSISSSLSLSGSDIIVEGR